MADRVASAGPDRIDRAGTALGVKAILGAIAHYGPSGLRAGLIRAGALPEDPSADDLRQVLVRINVDFRDKAPVSAAEAATVILDGVRSGAWRILIGEDAKMIDAAVRAKPEAPTTTPNYSGRLQEGQRREHPTGSSPRKQEGHRSQ